MKITVLVENSVCPARSGNLKAEHRLSLFIETGRRKILILLTALVFSHYAYSEEIIKVRLSDSEIISGRLMLPPGN